MVVCNICGRTHAAVIEIDDNDAEPLVRMECSYCRAMACDPVEEETDGM
jgi:hypothetical protein